MALKLSWVGIVEGSLIHVCSEYGKKYNKKSSEISSVLINAICFIGTKMRDL